jgi:phage recombination protein Bet
MTIDLAAIGTHDQALARLQDRADVIRQTVAPDANDQELGVFFEQCVRLGLDPVIRQAYLIKRQGRATLQVGIDGLRSIADRTGNYVGSDDPVFVDDEQGKPLSATVTVWKWVHGQRCPFSATARFDEYTANTPIWSQKPHVMIAKCAEALALRKAFPSQMEGAYVTEEMDQLDYEPKAVQGRVVEPVVMTPLSLKHLRAITEAGNLDVLKKAWAAVKKDQAQLHPDAWNTLVKAGNTRKADLEEADLKTESEPAAVS